MHVRAACTEGAPRAMKSIVSKDSSRTGAKIRSQCTMKQLHKTASSKSILGFEHAGCILHTTSIPSSVHGRNSTPTPTLLKTLKMLVHLYSRAKKGRIKKK